MKTEREKSLRRARESENTEKEKIGTEGGRYKVRTARKG